MVGERTGSCRVCTFYGRLFASSSNWLSRMSCIRTCYYFRASWDARLCTVASTTFLFPSGGFYQHLRPWVSLNSQVDRPWFMNSGIDSRRMKDEGVRITVCCCSGGSVASEWGTPCQSPPDRRSICIQHEGKWVITNKTKPQDIEAPGYLGRRSGHAPHLLSERTQLLYLSKAYATAELTAARIRCRFSGGVVP